MRRWKLLAVKAVVVLVSLTLAVSAAEFVMSKYRPSYDVGISESYVYDEELAFALRPGAHLYRTTDFQQESRTNALGTSNFQESFEGYERMVFAVGDSYTQGTGVAADQSYPFQLDLTLNRDERGLYARRYAVVNLGVAGYGGEQNLIALRRAAERFGAPSVILYLGCENDFDDDLLFKGGHRHRGWDYARLRWFWDKTQTGVKLKRFLVSRRRAALHDAALKQMGVARQPPSGAELQQQALESLAAYARERGALLVVSWSDAGRSYEWLKVWAGGQGVAFADWVPGAKSVVEAMPSLPLDNRHTGGHHRGWTNRVIAEEFARQIKSGGR